jgi:hypothetical protein
VTGPERTDKSISEWVSANPLPAVAVVIGALVVLGLLLGRLGDDEPTIEIPTNTSVPQASDTATTASTSPETFDPDRPEVGQLTCERLITSDEADQVLFEGVTGARGMFVFSQGETCRFDPNDESGNYLQIEPGDPADFAAGAELGGTPGRQVDGPGDAARWFDDGTSGVGILSVGSTVEIGSLIYRVHVGITELSESERLERARELASLALPRFPFVQIEEPEPEVVTFDDQPADLPPLSLDDVLFDGVDSGEWTLGEGLVTHLQGLVDGTLSESIGDLPEPSASGVLFEAERYIASGAGDAAEVQSLLDRLSPTREELAARVVEPESFARRLTVSLVELAQEENDDDVDTCVATIDDPCYVESAIEAEGLEAGKYEVFVAQPSKWTVPEFQAAKEALIDSATLFDDIARMPPTRVVLDSSDTSHAAYSPARGTCHAEIGEFISGRPIDEIKQIIARELAFCMIAFDLNKQLAGNPNPIRWLVFGLANYLSGAVYPSTNLEHEELPGQLAQEELSTTMPGRTWTNWIFFEHAHPSLGAEGAVDLIKGFPEDADLVAALSAVSGSSFRFHDLELALSDADVKDVGSGTVPYQPQAWELPVAGPTQVPLTVPQFGVRRLHISVQPGQFACVESSSQGDLRMSWRQGAPGGSGAWLTELPDFFQGELVMVITSVKQEASYTLEVTSVEDSPSDCDEEDEEADGGGSDPVEDLCLELCDPSTYYWGPLRFGT